MNELVVCGRVAVLSQGPSLGTKIGTVGTVPNFTLRQFLSTLLFWGIVNELNVVGVSRCSSVLRTECPSLCGNFSPASYSQEVQDFFTV